MIRITWEKQNFWLMRWKFPLQRGTQEKNFCNRPSIRIIRMSCNKQTIWLHISCDLIVSPTEKHSKEEREEPEASADHSGDHSQMFLDVEQDDFFCFFIFFYFLQFLSLTSKLSKMIRSSDLEGWKCFISSQPGDIHYGYDFYLHFFLEKKN